ncbi:MAG TPA: DUF4012 domain-containing protein [Acidimicrobiales bacterium]
MLVALVVVAGAVELARIRADLEAGEERLDQLDLDTVRRLGIEDTLAGAADRIDRAAWRAETSPVLGALAVVPGIGTQVDAVRDLTAAAEELGDAARDTGARISSGLDRAGGEPSARVELLDLVLGELDRIEALAADVDLGPGTGLVPPLRDARADLARSLDEVPTRFVDARSQLAALRRLLAGPTSYLVVVGNNAEMRTGAGMPLSAGLATIADGDIELGEFKSTVSEMYVEAPTGEHNANVPAELAETFPRWNLGRDYPETAVIPSFPTTAPMYADMAADSQGWETEGVVHVDAMALAALLEVVGPVEIEGVEYTARTAPQLVLNEPYLAFDTLDERDERLAAQSNLAGALFEAIQSRDIDPLDIVATLQDAAAGRHLMVWSRDPVLQELFGEFGVQGAIGPFDTLVSFLNTAANKLDWYIDPHVEVDAEALDTDQWLVEMTATIENPDGIRTSDYADGLLPELAGGTHRTLMLVHLPAFAEDVDMPGEEVTERGDDGTSQVIGTRFTIPRGASRTVTVRFRLPREINGLAVQPSARVDPVEWVVEGRRHDDDVAFIATFGEFPEDDGARGALTLAGALAGLAGAGFATLASRRPLAAGATALRRREVDLLTGLGLTALAVLLALCGRVV